MARKCVVEVLLSWEQKEILDLLGKMLGICQSEAMRTAFMEYAKDAKLIKQRMMCFNGRGKLVEKAWLSGADKSLSVLANQRQLTQKNVH